MVVVYACEITYSATIMPTTPPTITLHAHTHTASRTNVGTDCHGFIVPLSVSFRAGSVPGRRLFPSRNTVWQPGRAVFGVQSLPRCVPNTRPRSHWSCGPV